VLYYYRARYFDANVGRFISTDPIGFEAGDSNLYRYVNNSSTLFTDPSGKIIPILALALLGGLAAGAINVVHQDLKIIDGRQSEFNWGEFGASVGIGAVLTPLAVASPLLATGLVGYGAITGIPQGLKTIKDGNWLSGAFEVGISALPFGFKPTFKGNTLWNSELLGEVAASASKSVNNSVKNISGFFQDSLSSLSSKNRLGQSAYEVLPDPWLGTSEPYLGQRANSSTNSNPNRILSPSPIEFNPNLQNHLTTVEGVHQQNGILGGHTRQAFYKYVNDAKVIPEGANHPVNQIKIDSEINHPTIPGLSEIRYSILKGAKKGGFESQYKPIKDPKTVWDSDIIPDSYMIKLAKEASGNGYYSRIANGEFVYTSEAGGIYFRTYVDRQTNIIRNVHPKIGR
jgi:hypothetical protein